MLSLCCELCRRSRCISNPDLIKIQQDVVLSPLPSLPRLLLQRHVSYLLSRFTLCTRTHLLPPSSSPRYFKIRKNSSRLIVLLLASSHAPFTLLWRKFDLEGIVNEFGSTVQTMQLYTSVPVSGWVCLYNRWINCLFCSNNRKLHWFSTSIWLNTVPKLAWRLNKFPSPGWKSHATRQCFACLTHI